MVTRRRALVRVVGSIKPRCDSLELLVTCSVLAGRFNLVRTCRTVVVLVWSVLAGGVVFLMFRAPSSILVQRPLSLRPVVSSNLDSGGESVVVTLGFRVGVGTGATLIRVMETFRRTKVA